MPLPKIRSASACAYAISAGLRKTRTMAGDLGWRADGTRLPDIDVHVRSQLSCMAERLGVGVECPKRVFPLIHHHDEHTKLGPAARTNHEIAGVWTVHTPRLPQPTFVKPPEACKQHRWCETAPDADAQVQSFGQCSQYIGRSIESS
jgi:hypothetical protein